MEWFEYLILFTIVIFIILNICSFSYGIGIFNSNANHKFSFKRNFIFESHDLKYSPNVMTYRGMMIFSLLLPLLIFASFFQKDIFSTVAGYYVFFAYISIVLYLIVFGLSFFVKPVNFKLFTGLILGKYLLILLSLSFSLCSCIFRINRLSLMNNFSESIPFIVLVVVTSFLILFNISLLANRNLYSWYLHANSEEKKTNFFALFEWINVLMLYASLVLMFLIYIFL